MITKQQRDAIQDREQALHEWMQDTGRVTRHGGSYHPDDLPENINPPTNDERAKVEIYDFMTDKPRKYMAYINLDKAQVTTFTGVSLGSIKSKKLHAINGLVYTLKPVKNSDLVKMTAI